MEGIIRGRGRGLLEGGGYWRKGVVGGGGGVIRSY